MTDPHPFHKLLPEHTVFLRRRALWLTRSGHRADDLVQTTLLRAWAGRESFTPDTNLRAWLFTILRNTFFSELRKYRHEVQDVDGERALSVAVEAGQDDAVYLNELIGAITLLPACQRRALVMMGIFGFSQLEVADACGCTHGTVKSRVSRGRATLTSFMEHDTLLRQRTVDFTRKPKPAGESGNKDESQVRQ